MAEPRRGLGRGLSALIGEAAPRARADAPPGAGGHELPVEAIRPNPSQPRRRFDEAELDELAASIGEKGVLQPILVRPSPDGEGYEIVAGERRWRAAQRAGLTMVPAQVRTASDSEAIEMAIVENVQRTDLSAIEEAEGYRQLVERFGRTQAQIAATVGKSRAHVANTMRLLQLPAPVQDYLRDGRLTAGHGRALVGAPDAEGLATLIAVNGYSVRQAEAMARPREVRTVEAKPKVKDPDTAALECDLADALGLQIEVRTDTQEKGEVRIFYRTLEQLDEVCRRLIRR